MKHLVMFVAVAASLLAIAPAQAQINLRNFNVGSVIDAVQGVTKSQEVSSMSVEDEIAIGRDIAARTLGTYPLVRDEALQRYLNTVGVWVALQTEKPALPWRFGAVKSDQVNAFAVPGGTVLITTGMLKLIGNEAELACVIGHEAGHIIRRHHIDLLQKDILTATGSKVLGDNLGGGGIKGQVSQMANKEGAQLFMRSLDRGAERDADSDGVVYAARAGYDPESCLILMQRMASQKQDAGTLAALYKTHPNASERVKDVGAALAALTGAAAGEGARPPLAYRKAGNEGSAAR
jgi:predicted Zn-dependent protease